jgi:hypothetical protein
MVGCRMNDAPKFAAMHTTNGLLVVSERPRSFRLIAASLTLFCGTSLLGCTAKTLSSRTACEQAALASDSRIPLRPGGSDVLDYDPWEAFNQQTLSFNFNVLDQYALKPAAKVWS